MSEDNSATTNDSQRYPRRDRVPLASVLPLRRSNFARAGSDSDKRPVEKEAKLSATSHAAKSAQLGRPKPVYAATFHGDEPTSSVIIQSSASRDDRRDISKLDDFPLPRYEAPEERRLVIKPRNWFKLTSRFVAGGIAAIFLMGSFFAWYSYSRASSGLAEAAPSAAILSTASPEKLTKEGDARINILLLGVGGQGHAGADLSDTMMVASIDPVNKTAALLSIPRDLWVEMPNQYFGTHQKINAVYSAGKYKFYQQHGKEDEKAAVQAGLSAVDTVVEQVIGVPIQYHALLDFSAFKQAVDAVGGITVDVKTPLIDPTMAWENGGNATLAKAGSQEMDGAAALRYVRSRHTSSDFSRSVRQREILVALRKKILTTGTLANPLKLQQLMSAFGNNVFTDISTVDMVRLYNIISTIDESAITSLDLASGNHALVTTDTVGSASVVRPKLGFDRYSDIQTYVRSQLRDGYLLKEHATVAVGAASQSAAEETGSMLSDIGYQVNSMAMAKNLNVTKTTVVDMSGGLAPYTRHYLEKRYGENFLEKLPEGLVVPDGTQFVILVGE